MNPLHPLSSLFMPQSLAVVGASERESALGRFVLANVRDGGFKGPLYAVNPKHEQVLGVACFPCLSALPQTVELAVIVTDAHVVPAVLEDAGAAGVKAVIILSSGFGEKAASGRTLQEESLEIARRHGIRILGPNCLGVATPAIGLNATFARAKAEPGKVALISQSGAICTAVLDVAATESLGFSKVISLGSAIDVDFGEILDYLRQDETTEAILLYIEGLHDAHAFITALREAALVKPVIVMKAGRYASGSQAASSHSGAMMGRDEVFEAVFRRCGAVRVDTYTQLIAAARTLAGAHVPAGDRLGILTNGGGLAVIAADSVSRNETALASISDKTVAALSAALPASWSHANPIDIIGDATAERFGKAVKIALADEGSDALLVLYCPTVPAEPVACAEAVASATSGADKPVLAVWLDRSATEKCADVFEAQGIAHFASPEDAVEAFSFLAAYRRNQTQLRVAPAIGSQVATNFDLAAIKQANAIFRTAKQEQRTLLSEYEAKTLLHAFGLPVAETVIASSRDQAVAAAEKLGFPVVIKIHSPDITHKSDVGGVRLDLQNSAMVATAFDDMLAHVRELKPQARIVGVTVQPMLRFDEAREVLIGVATDPLFGPVISFGAGGVAVEVLHDIAVALPPLDSALADDLIRRTRINNLLQHYRNVPAADLAGLSGLLVRISELLSVLPWISEMDLNPVLVHPGGVAVVDARIVIDSKSIPY